MNKYTVIYLEKWQVGSHWQAQTRMKHLECDIENIFKILDKEGICPDFIFKGHLKSI